MAGSKSLEQKALHSFKWSLLGEVFSKAISPLVLVILAKILLPEDFGVVAAATVVISFSQVFWDAGLAKALIQRRTQIDESANVVFWVNLVLSVSLLTLLYFFAEGIAQLFHDPRIADVLRVLGVQLPLAALCSVHTALQQREFGFRQLFWVRILTTTTPMLASIPLALHGAGYWALVAGTLVGQFAQLLTLWKISRWRPVMRFDRGLARKLASFGQWSMLSALLGWFFLWMDALIVGGFLGTHDLGLYRTGNALVSLVFGLIAGPLIPVLYSLLSGVGEDLVKLRQIVQFVEKVMMMVVIPAGLGLMVLKNVIPSLVFTDKWMGVGEIIGIIGITQAISYTVSVRQEVYRAIGKPEIETRIMLVSMLIRLPFYLVSIHFGIIAFAWARFVSTLLGVMNHLFFARRFIDLSYLGYFKSLLPALIAGAVMLLVGMVSDGFFAARLALFPRTLAVISVCVITYTVLIGALDTAFVKRAIGVIREPRVLSTGDHAD